MPISTKFGRNVTWESSLKIVHRIWFHEELWLSWQPVVVFLELLKCLLWKNRWSEFEMISQRCTFGDPFQNWSGNFDPSRNMALLPGGYLHYTDMKKFLKIPWNRSIDSDIISQKCSLGNPFQNCWRNFDLSRNMALMTVSRLHYTNTIQTWKNSWKFFSLKKLVGLWNKFPEMSLGNPFQKLFPKFWPSRNMALMEVGFLLCTDKKKFLENSSSLKPMVRFWNNFAWLTLFENFSRKFDPSRSI